MSRRRPTRASPTTPARVPLIVAEPSALRRWADRFGQRLKLSLRRFLDRFAPEEQPVPPFLEAIREARLREMGLLPPLPETRHYEPEPDTTPAKVEALRHVFRADTVPHTAEEKSRNVLTESEPIQTPAQIMTAHALNLTLVFVALPLGAAMATYGVLRGGPRLVASARMMAVAGTALAVFGPVSAFGLTPVISL